MKTILICSILSLIISKGLPIKLDENKAASFEYPSVSMEVFSPDSIKVELESLIQQIQEIHPCLGMIVDYGKLMEVKQDILSQVNAPMNQLDVFRLYSLLNPVLSDAHNGIMLPKYKTLIQEATASGDRLFPIAVHVDNDYRLWVKKDSHGLTAASEILSINGLHAVEITKKLERHARGDNSVFRRSLVADRFSEFLWMHYGSSKTFELKIKEGKKITSKTLMGSENLLPHRRANQQFEDQYSFEFLANNQVGYLNTKTFYLPEGTEKWYGLTDSIFRELREKDSQYLIIDIRRNGGGDDMLWIEGIMPYIAKKKWQRMNHFLGRVREIDSSYPGRLGEVAIFDFYGEYEVSEKPKFDGEVYVIVGRGTYSSAIMFSSVLKDNELGIIVGHGKETDARGCSTGMFVYHEMRTSDLVAFTPQHWYQRNTGESCMTGVPIDISLNDNPYNEHEIVESLVQQLTASK